MYGTGFSPDARNFGGRTIIVGSHRLDSDGLVAHTINLHKISQRTPQGHRNRMTSQGKIIRKSHSRCSKNSDTKPTYRSSRQKLKEHHQQPKLSNRRPIYTFSNCITKTSYNDLDLGVIQRDYNNKELLEALRHIDMNRGENSNKRIFKRLINHVVKNRIIKDEQFDQLFIDMVNAYPQHEERLRTILVEVVSALDF